jgi:Mor family transcriptional regulator
MIDVTPEYLLNVVDEVTAQKIWESLQGMRIYFPKSKTKHNKILEDYRAMTKKYITKAESVKQLMYKYEMSQSQVRNIIRSDDRVLFDVA